MSNGDRNNAITPSPLFIARQHTGKFFNLLPDTFMIKGAKSELGFDQGYALKKRNQKEYILIDVVELATKDAVKNLVHEGNKILALLISGDTVLKDAYANLKTLSEDAGGAEIYIHPKNASDGSMETRDLLGNKGILNGFNIHVQDLPPYRNGGVLIYSSLNQGMLFTGDKAHGSPYSNDESLFFREKLDSKNLEFQMAETWDTYKNDFYYLFPRRGKPAIEVDGGTRTEILNRLSRGLK